MSLEKGNVKNKSFRYPPILPIVYYEGSEDWSADLHLKDRIMMNEFFEGYIPDFTYKLVRNHDYSNEELLKNEDEMSLLMMLGKAQTPEELHQLVNAEKEKMDAIIKKAPEHILELIAKTVWNLCMKMNVPQEEAKKCVREVRRRQMGYWFENMEKMDIQAERRNTAEARAELEKAKQELEKSRKDAEKAQKDAEKVREELEKVQKSARENEIKVMVNICRKHGVSKEQAAREVIENCHLKQKEAEEKVALYWKE